MARLLRMQALRLLGLVAMHQVQRAQAHGTTLLPWGRIKDRYYCPWCLGEKLPEQNPSGIINRSTRPSSPCLGSTRHGPTFGAYSFGSHEAHAGPPDAIYSPGQTFEARVLLAADHQGEATWMLCPHTEEETEECFRENQFMGWEDVHAWWGLDSSTRQSFSNHWFPQSVTLPSDLPYGSYTLRWFWVCLSTNEVFLSCIDIEVGAGGAAPVPTPPVVPTEAPAPSPLPAPPAGADCVGDWGNCRSSKCCQAAPYYQCYEKDQHYAQCRPSCPSDWSSCAVLTPDGTPTQSPTEYPTADLPSMAPTPPPTVSPVPTAAPSAVPSPTTTTMMPTTAPTAAPTAATPPPTTTMLPTMAPTATPTAATVSPVPSPTTAMPTMTPTATPTGTAPCAGSWQNCQASTCCMDSSQTCYEQNQYYAQCRPSCPTSGWTCRGLGSPEAPTTPAPTAGPGCLSAWQKCGGIGWGGPTTCCSGTACEVVNDWYHQCKPSARLAEVKRHRAFLSAADRATRSPALVQKDSDLRQLFAAAEEEEEEGDEWRRAEL